MGFPPGLIKFSWLQLLPFFRSNPLILGYRLILKGREQEALEVLCALSDLSEDDPKIQSEFNAVKDTVFEMAQGRFRDCFATNKNRNLHRTILAYVNQMFQQVSILVPDATGNRMPPITH